MLTLLTHGGGDGFYSYSMFCTKAALLLQMSGATWQRHDVFDPAELDAMPHQKLPVVRDEAGALIPDSEGIRRLLETRGADFDQGLSAAQKGQSRALIRMIDGTGGGGSYSSIGCGLPRTRRYTGGTPSRTRRLTMWEALDRPPVPASEARSSTARTCRSAAPAVRRTTPRPARGAPRR